MIAPIAVLGAGSWGTALAIQFARAGKPTRLWGRDAAQVRKLAAERVNADYLPGCKFPPALKPVADLREAVQGADDVLAPAKPSRPGRSLGRLGLNADGKLAEAQDRRWLRSRRSDRRERSAAPGAAASPRSGCHRAIIQALPSSVQGDERAEGGGGFGIVRGARGSRYPSPRSEACLRRT